MKMTAQSAGRLGALKRNSLYGNPATAESRRKGGIASLERFLSNPQLSSQKRFKLEKKILIPERGEFFSEFIGIVLGDGNITDYQVRIYFNARTDKRYADFVKDLALRLFNIDSSISTRVKNTLELTISSRALVKLLVSSGLKIGNKIKQEISVPNWVLENKQYAHACLRGLMDTDGGVYFHVHETKGIKYRNIALCFTSRSKPLLYAVGQILFAIGIVAKNDMKERIFVYNREGIERYMTLIGSHNPNLISRFNSHTGNRLLS